MSFVDFEVHECIEHVSDKEEEGLEDDRGRYGASVHSSILTTLNVLIDLWALACVSVFLLYFHLCPKISVSKFQQCLNQFISQSYMNSRNVV